jgi:prefoldin subunit 5
MIYMDDSVKELKAEIKKLKEKRKEVKSSLKEWASGNTQIYDENGKRISGEPLAAYENLTI